VCFYTLPDCGSRLPPSIVIHLSFLLLPIPVVFYNTDTAVTLYNVNNSHVGFFAVVILLLVFAFRV